MNPPRPAAALTRRDHPAWSPAPVRMVHLGLGAFFRAHQAWYTAHTSDAAEWGIAAFTGHTADLAERLSRQDGLYTLTSRGPVDDAVEVVSSVVEAHPGTDTAAWLALVASPEVHLISLSVTEAAYGSGADAVAARLVDGLDARRRADAGPVTIVPCDNIAANDRVLLDRLHTEAERRDDRLVDWIDRSVAVVGTVVDRITPRAAPGDETPAAAAGWEDAAPVVTEPFSEWVLSGAFAVGHPDWVSAGAVLTDDLAPYARRKLHLLNGAHSLLAYAGSCRGHDEVADVMGDATVWAAVEAWWDEAGATVGGTAAGRADYRNALTERFANPRLHHRLAQIAIDGSTKLPERVVPVARAELAAGHSAEAAAVVLGAWIAFLGQAGDGLVDARRDAVLAAAGDGPDATRRVLALIAPELAEDTGFVIAVADAAGFWAHHPGYSLPGRH